MKTTASKKTGLIVGLTMLFSAAGVYPSAVAKDPSLVIEDQGAFFVGGLSLARRW